MPAPAPLREPEQLGPAQVPAVSSPTSPSESTDYDAVTEFIPVTPNPPGYQQPVDDSSETLFIPQGGVPAGNEQTVMLPQALPSGSDEQPPGATPQTPSWEGPQSRSVTNSGSPGGPPPPAARGWSGWATEDSAAEDETVVRRDPPFDRPEEPTVVRRPDDRDTNGRPAEPGREPSLFTPGVPTAAVPIGGPDQPAGSDPTVSENAPADLPPAGPDGEPPEETADAVAASAVAALQDEVVVVDERPRYHVGGCSFLPGRPVIPLPVAEAIELGFSPCGWCTPVRVLDERRRATAR